ncbi:interleukin-10 receptor subunit beta-like isoform X2 [Alosa pseudoharengus]|uniref:interleukin-10 receptor subunit beta-like isoform X2 n=1 Tax=Alosa pseudoharengus TaxID=34774 RepID=UPI003F88B4C6
MDTFGAMTLPHILILMSNIMFFNAQPHLLKPYNVTFIKMGAVLTWTSPTTHITNITYTAQYSWGKRSFKSIDTCIEVKELCCGLKLPSTYGIYTFRVRAHLQGATSEWVKSTETKVTKFTDPPAVSMVLRYGVMELNITEPKYDLSCFLVNNVTYNITYWRQHLENETWQRTVQQRKVHRLPVSGLPSEGLCVKVHTVYAAFNNAGVQFETAGPPSKPVCALNSPHGEPKYIHSYTALVGCLTSLAVLSVLILGWCVYKGQNFLYPNAALPQQLIQCPPERSFDMPQMLLHAEEPYEHISVWEPQCETHNSEEMSAVGVSDGVSNICVYESLSIVCMSEETVFHRMVEPTNNGMLEQRYYNVLS